MDVIRGDKVPSPPLYFLLVALLFYLKGDYFNKALLGVSSALQEILLSKRGPCV